MSNGLPKDIRDMIGMLTEVFASDPEAIGNLSIVHYGAEKTEVWNVGCSCPKCIAMASTALSSVGKNRHASHAKAVH